MGRRWHVESYPKDAYSPKRQGIAPDALVTERTPELP
jgi:hypothetical protein